MDLRDKELQLCLICVIQPCVRGEGCVCKGDNLAQFSKRKDEILPGKDPELKSSTASVLSGASAIFL